MPDGDDFDELAFKRLQLEAEAERERFREWHAGRRREWSELLARDELRTAPASSRRGVIGTILPDIMAAGDAVSLERYSALERVRGMIFALVDIADDLADRTVSEARAAAEVRLVNELQQTMWGRTLEGVAMLSLIDQIDHWQREVASEKLDLDEAVSRTIGGMSLAGFPKVTDAIRLNQGARDAVRAAIRDWSEGTGHWKAVTCAVELAGLGERDPESVRRQWAQWRHDPVRPPVIP